MSESFDPMIQLKALLGDKPNHPWGALIPQVLLWCFKRFCIQKLIETSDLLLLEQLWDDHLDLIHQHAPKGLESVSASWFTPENIEHVYSSLEEYNRFFMEVLVAIDNAVRESDSDAENTIAEFLDVDIKNIVRDWLGEEYKSFLIFPMDDEADDEFTDEQFNELLEALMRFMSANPAPAEAAPPEAAPPEAAPAEAAPPEAAPPEAAPPEVLPNPNPPYYPYFTLPPPYLFAQHCANFREPLKTRRVHGERATCGKTRRNHYRL
jgi:hypothetical protein